MKLKCWSASFRFPGLGLAVVLGVSGCHRLPETAQNSPQPAVQPKAQARVETDDEKSCREFVQGFYDWYFDRLNRSPTASTGVPTFDDVERLKPEVLIPSLRQMLKDDLEASSKDANDIVGLDFDPYINAQDWEGKYSIEKVSTHGGKCRAALWGTDSGKKREIVEPELVFSNNQWVFVNFHYPGNSAPRDENLADILIALRNDRNAPKK